jgi:hypothetical protein
MSDTVPMRNSGLSSKLVAAKAGNIEALLAPGKVGVGRVFYNPCCAGHYNFNPALGE